MYERRLELEGEEIVKAAPQGPLFRSAVSEKDQKLRAYSQSFVCNFPLQLSRLQYHPEIPPSEL